MVDGSHLPFKDNVSYTKCISSLAHSKKMLVEAELGRLSGTEDDLTVADYEAKLTDVNQVPFPLSLSLSCALRIHVKINFFQFLNLL